MSPLEIGLVLAGSFFGGFVNAIAGGGGLVSLPVTLGVFPEASLPSIFGTTKSAMVWGTAWSARSYAAHVKVAWMRLVPAMVMAVFGGLIGAWLLTYFESEWLRKVLPCAACVCVLVHPGESSFRAGPSPQLSSPK